MGSIYVFKKPDCFVYRAVKWNVGNLSYMKLFLGRMNLTASSLNNI